MKLTNDQLKQIIREELSKLSEAAHVQGGAEENNPGMAMNKPKGMKTSYGHVKEVDTLEEETADEREDHNIKDLYAMARGNRKALNKLLKKADMDELEIEDQP